MLIRPFNFQFVGFSYFSVIRRIARYKKLNDRPFLLYKLHFSYVCILVVHRFHPDSRRFRCISAPCLCTCRLYNDIENGCMGATCPTGGPLWLSSDTQEAFCEKWLSLNISYVNLLQRRPFAPSCLIIAT